MTYRLSLPSRLLVEATLIGLLGLCFVACTNTPPPDENFRRAHPERDAGELSDAGPEGAVVVEGAGTAE